MKILERREVWQITFNYSSDIDFRNVINIYEKCTVKPYYFVVDDMTLVSDNPLCFRNNILEKI